MNNLMKWILIGTAVLMLGGCNNGSDVPSSPAKDYTRSVTVNGVAYQYNLHVPVNLVSSPAPLVLSLHAGGTSGLVHDVLTQLPLKAEQAGFVLLTPAGSKDELFSWNAGSCCRPATTDNIDHVAVIRAMLDDATAVMAIDPKRVFATGYSNGGMMAYRLACELSDRIAAIAPVAAEMMDKDLTLGAERTVFACAPPRTVPVLHLHGLADTCAPYNGGPSTGAQTLPPRSAVPDNIAFWREHNHCTVAGTPSTQGDTTCTTYSGCDDGANVKLCTVTGGGHIWPGAPYADAIKQECGGAAAVNLNANDQLWSFFSTHPKP